MNPRMFVLAMLLASKTVFANAFSAETPREVRDVASEQGQDAMHEHLNKMIPGINDFKVSLGELKQEIHETSPAVEAILTLVEQNLTKSADTASAALKVTDAQVVLLKYVQTKMYMSLARAELTRAASAALRAEGLEPFAKKLLALGQSIDDLLSSVRDI
jgi:hypothetical protein